MSALQTAITELQVAESNLAKAVKGYSGSVAGKTNDSVRNALVSERNIKSRVELLRNQIENDGQSLILDWEHDVAIVNGEARRMGEVVDFTRSTGGGRIGPDGKYEWIPATRTNAYIGNHDGKSGSYTQSGTPLATFIERVGQVPIFNLSGGSYDQSLTARVPPGRYTVSAWFHKDSAVGITVYINSFGGSVNVSYSSGKIIESLGDYRRTAVAFTQVSGSVTLRRPIGLIAGGIQVEPGIRATEYIPTEGSSVTVQNNAPRIDYHPATGECRGILTEGQRTNHLTQSSNLTVGTTRPNVSITSAGIMPITNEGEVYLCSDSTGSGEHYVEKPAPLVAGTYTASIYAKPKGATRFIFRPVHIGEATPTSEVVFTYSSGVYSPTTTSNNRITNAGVEVAPDGFFRLWVTYSITSATTSHGFRFHPVNTGHYVGDPNIGTWCFGPQLENGKFPTSYIPTTAASVTRSEDFVTIRDIDEWYNHEVSVLFVRCSVFSTFSYPRILTLNGDLFAFVHMDFWPTRIYLHGRGSQGFGYVTYGPKRDDAFEYALMLDSAKAAASVNGDTAVESARPRLLRGNYLSLGGGGAEGQGTRTERLEIYPYRLSLSELQELTA